MSGVYTMSIPVFPPAVPGQSSSGQFSLYQLGWRPFYSQQLTLEDLDAGWPARVASVHRSVIAILGEHGECNVSLPGSLLPDDSASAVTVGDWVLVERTAPRISRILERASLIARMSAGIQQRVQPVAANLDTLFVVTSCNEDFNPSRLERYLAVAFEAQVEPVIVLTKADLCADAAIYADDAMRISHRVCAVALNAMSGQAATLLAPWLTAGQSVAFVGSSGVGKSTLVNTLVNSRGGSIAQATGGIREHDAKGRHTTTARQLIAMPGGTWLIDTPGMRELKVGAAEAGVSAVFTDIALLAQSCRFRDCSHQGDEGCALRLAVASGEMGERRLRSYLKLQREAANAARTVHERRERDRQFGRMHKAVQERHRKDKHGR